MQSLFNIINKPFGYVLMFLAKLFNGNFAASVFVFTLLINLILIPLSIKSQKSSVSQMRIKPKLDELKKKYGDDRKRMAQEQQKLYQQEGVSMSGGCLPMIIRMVLLLSIYWLIMSPLTYMAGADQTKVDNVGNGINTALEAIKEKSEDDYDATVKRLSWANKSNYQLSLIKIIKDGVDLKDVITEDVIIEEGSSEKGILRTDYEKIMADYDYVVEKYNDAGINFDLFGIDLTTKPDFSFDIFNKWEAIWLLPIMAFLAQMLTSIVSMRINKRVNPDAPTMAGMLLFMPVISLIIGFNFPGGVCFYWICSSLIGGAIQSAIQILYGPHKLLARDREKELAKVCDFEAGQQKKFETETE